MRLSGKRWFFAVSVGMNVFFLVVLAILLLSYHFFLPSRCQRMLRDMSRILNMSQKQQVMMPIVSSTGFTVYKADGNEECASYALAFKSGNCEYLLFCDPREKMCLYEENTKYAWRLSWNNGYSFELAETCSKRFNRKTVQAGKSEVRE